MTKPKSRAGTPKEWADVAPLIRREVEDRLRGGMLASIDQAERFRDLTRGRWSETTARAHDRLANEYREALLVLNPGALKAAAKRGKTK